MADEHMLPKDADMNQGKSPPPAYSEVVTDPAHPGALPPEHGGYAQPYPQPYMQGYHYPPGQAPPEAGGKHQEYPAYPPPGHYPPGPPGYPPGPPGYPPGPPGYPPGQPGYPPGQQYPPGSGAYSQGPYNPGPYGHGHGSVVVTQPSGATLVVAQSPPPDNMVLSALACLCCFCPIGSCALMYSCWAKGANNNQDYQAALKYGAQAKRLAIISIIIGAIFIIVGIVLRLVVYTTYSTYSH
ncbi:uncharacterized protein [Littorina saxatilis]